MAGVKRLAPDPRGRVRASPPPAVTRRALPPTAPTPASPPIAHEEDDHAASSFAAPGVDRRELRKLKRGAHTATSRLDLHGMTAAQATTAVARFIERSRTAHRCVCIVHG